MKGFVIIDVPECCDKCRLRHMGMAYCNVAGRSTSHTNAGKPLVCTVYKGGGFTGQLFKGVDEEDEVNKMDDLISRQAAIDALHMHLMYRMGTDSNKKRLDDWINSLPSAQPERTCVNCGRTANNGGWYADGGTRCPIEEHYALPKDGFCHLWEKRNITDDDYPERRTDD